MKLFELCECKKWARFVPALPFLLIGAIGLMFLWLGALIWGEEI